MFLRKPMFHTNVSSSSLRHHPKDPPREPVMNSLLENQGGHLAIIGCTVDSDPPSEVALYKGDVLLGSTSGAHSAVDSRMSLTPSYNMLKVTIQDVTLEDEGRYVCSAQNHYGESTTSMDFTAASKSLTEAPEHSYRDATQLV